MAEVLTISRVIDAPVAEVWRAWTDPESVKRWWGPEGYTSPVATIDLREGGKYLFSIRSPDGQMSYSTGVYQKIVPLQRLEFTDSFADEYGNVVPGSYYGMGEFPMETHITVQFEELADSQTRLTVTQDNMPSAKMAEDVRNGWSEFLDKLEGSLQEAKQKAVDY